VCRQGRRGTIRSCDARGGPRKYNGNETVGSGPAGALARVARIDATRKLAGTSTEQICLHKCASGTAARKRRRD
jgi:hypothetical protein